jgi:hypothetical protein
MSFGKFLSLQLEPGGSYFRLLSTKPKTNTILVKWAQELNFKISF